MLILVSGPSGVGKSSVIDALMQIRKLEFMKTYTTRETRAQNDGAYEHVSKQEFEKMIEKGAFLEYENVHADIFYGTPFSTLEKVIEGKADYIKDIDVHGVQKIKNYLAGKSKLVTVFLDSPDQELRRRLIKRGESEEMIEKRLSRVKMEREFKSQYDLVLECKDIAETAKEIDRFCKEKV